MPCSAPLVKPPTHAVAPLFFARLLFRPLRALSAAPPSARAIGAQIVRGREPIYLLLLRRALLAGRSSRALSSDERDHRDNQDRARPGCRRAARDRGKRRRRAGGVPKQCIPTHATGMRVQK